MRETDGDFEENVIALCQGRTDRGSNSENQ